MIFQHTGDWIFGVSPHTGMPKTATSRLVKPGDMGLVNLKQYPWLWVHYDQNGYAVAENGHENILAKLKIVTVQNSTRTVYEVGKDYAVQPGRGKKAVGRVRITGIDRYDVRTITAAQARAEGFNSRWIFLKLWASMHDPVFYRDWISMANDSAEAVIPVVIERRPTNRYDAWLLTFEPVSEVKP